MGNTDKKQVLGYIRVSTEKQDLEKQKHFILDYAHKNKIVVDEFIEVEISSKKTQEKRKITELKEKLDDGDTLIIAELSRLGRNMLEVLNLIEDLTKQGVNLVFVRQPELSTQNGSMRSLLLAIYGYFAESEREFIAMRTKQGLAAARAKGKILGRPKGSKNKERLLDPYKEEILQFINIGLGKAPILKIINSKLDKNTNLTTLTYCINNDKELKKAYEQKRG